MYAVIKQKDAWKLVVYVRISKIPTSVVCQRVAYLDQ